ncbi:bifunctional DNA-formamidopyrimidine glycosylase/DNA-(apurinic or apyrimidinic site) lyase [Austwickia chelonae]|uniref:bifunctional DNA-formamidopyrimidine glycosylase/DNA-(apurinic or apyrimidinic site) lyase n=1 Tax=Austwickia chelonae TaxID=100225 RepID=UPI000E225D6C|nr:bifunctional DNA-formamidopyrimidine glycosylase/DNA-(apurinic or apyrimidinic site) lyase [Austwickia chelonae]
MPELPEVEVVRRGLQEHVLGRTIASLQLSGTRVARRHLAGPSDLAARVTGQRCVAVERRGKYLWLVLEPSSEALIVHLGMSGQVLVSPKQNPRHKHQHATFDFDDHGPQLRFIDQRTFGGLAWSELVADRKLARSSLIHGVPASIEHIAPDPLEEGFVPADVATAMLKRRTAVKRALLDQRLVSGIGNIYADEALWRAGLHGEQLASSLSLDILLRTLDHARQVMTEALDAGGTSFDALYVNVNGASGYFSRELSAYGQAGRPCRRCGTPIVREAFMNRSSHFCPQCQLLPS